MDPFAETPTLIMIGDVQDPITKQRYERTRGGSRAKRIVPDNSGVRTRRTSEPRRSFSFSTT